MIKKIEKSKNFIHNYSYLFECPLCHKKLKVLDNNLICDLNHSFDISKKGVIVLTKTSRFKPLPLYDTNLFINRREFINNNFY
jgi:23S rRNA (guanine745-N1)-methyltransferase